MIAEANYLNTVRLKALGNSMEWSRRRLSIFRQNRFNSIRQYIGKNYSEEGTNDKVPLPMMELAIDTYAQRLVARQPRVMVTTEKPDLRAQALENESRINHELRELNFKKTMRACVKDALFMQGIARVGICQSSTYDDDDQGKTYVEPVSFDDWVYDMHAHRWDHVQYCGNRYQMNLEEVREDKSFNEQARKSVQPSFRSMYNEQGDPRTAIFTETANSSDATDFEPMVEMWDLWLPRKKLLVTIASDPYSGVSQDSQVLREMDWDGPRCGPYKILDYFDVPDNIIGLSLAAILYDLHMGENAIYRKLLRQALRQKSIGLYRRNAEEDAQRIKRANDGDMVAGDDPGGFKEVNFGGPNKENLAFAIQSKEFYTYFGGNIDMLGGLAPQSKTLGQDKILDAGATQRIQDMQSTTNDFAESIISDVAWYVLDEKTQNVPLTKHIHTPYGKVEMPFTYQGDKLGQWIDYNFTIAQYSMQHKGPQEHLETLQFIMEKFVAPLQPQMQAQGQTINIQGLLREVAHLTDFPFLDQIIEFGGPEQAPGMAPGGAPGAGAPGAPQPPAMPASTSRHYVRENRPGGTAGGQAREMVMGLLSGADRQPAQAAHAMGS